MGVKTGYGGKKASSTKTLLSMNAVNFTISGAEGTT